MPSKFDDFRPRQAGSIDGFVTGAGQQPRRPAFRSTLPQTSQQPSSTPQPIDLPEPRNYNSLTAKQDVAPQSTSQQAKPQPQERLAIVPELQDTLNPYTETSKTSRQKRAEKGKKPTSNRKRRFKTFAKVLGVVFLVGVLAFGFRFYRDVAKITGNNNPLSLLGVFNPADLKNENGRVNVLVAGNSADDLGHNGGELTDSLMLLSVDTRNNTALMLSIPRDLWVKLPGEGSMKINSVYPLQGMDGLKSTVEDVTGMPVHYTALVNYTAFRDLVNAVGGISITIKSDDPRGIYDPSLDYTSRTCCALAKYPNGPVDLNGKQALNLARARGEGYGSYGFAQADFTRTEHQRNMLLGIKDRASDPAVIANPFKVSNLFSAVAGNVKTDLQIDEIQTLYYYSKKIDATKIDSYNINTLKGKGTTMLANYTSPNGQSALIPTAGVDDFSEISLQIRRLFNADPVSKEAATVVILNSTDYVGLAKQQTNKLLAKGMDVASEGNFATVQQQTTVIDNTANKMPNTKAYLTANYKASVVQDAATLARYPNADFIIILGNSAAPNPNATTSN